MPESKGLSKLEALKAKRAAVQPRSEAAKLPPAMSAPAKKTAPKKLPKDRKKEQQLTHDILDPDVVMASMFREVVKETGRDDIVAADESENLILGLALPALSLRYLFQMDICPLSRIIQVTGKRGSSKSSFLYEIFRWTMVHGGLGVYFENEGKDAPDLRASILENNPSWLHGRVRLHPCEALEDWQEGLTFWIKEAGKICNGKAGGKEEEDEDEDEKPKGKKAAGKWSIPFFFAIDSFTATNTRGARDSIKKQGSAKRMHPEQAMLLSHYARNLPSMIAHKPILIAGTNHGKEGTDGNGRPTWRTPGGSAIGFMETLEIRMTKIGVIDTLQYGGNIIELRTDKNSLGQTGRKIVARMLWTIEPGEDGQPVQQTHWDWYAASIDMLVGLKKIASLWKSINAVVDLHPSDTGRRIWSKALGVTSDSPVSFTEMGRRLEMRPDILEQLYPLLRIKRRTVFRPGVDYMTQARAATRFAEAASPYVVKDLSEFEFINTELDQAKPIEPPIVEGD